MRRIPDCLLDRRAFAGAGVVALGCLLFSGCTRDFYHRAADIQSNDALWRRQFDPRWLLPPRPVEAQPESRMFDGNDPDHTAIPPDDPAARPFQVSRASPFEWVGWRSRGTTDIEPLDWLTTIPREPDGLVKLSRDTVMNLALVNSREYQFQYEDLYLNALAVTLAEFQFAIQGFSRNSLFYQHFGGIDNDSNQLQLGTDTGFTKLFATGAQLAIAWTNDTFFEYHGRGFTSSLSSLPITLTQPLLRNAWTRIVTQPLSVQERGVLYAVRDFSRYRRSFYVDVVAVNGYLGLLLQLQALRNQERNLEALERNVREARALVEANQYSILQRDQIDQQYQQAKFALLQAEAGLQTTVDNYKLRLGLPADFPVRLDDEPLKLFELNDPRFDGLRGRNDQLVLDILNDDDGPLGIGPARLIDRLSREYDDFEAILNQAREEARKLVDQADAAQAPKPGDDPADARPLRAIELAEELEECRSQYDDDRQRIAKLIARLDRTDPDEARRELYALANDAFRARFAEAFVAQTQVRVFLIDLVPVNLGVTDAIEYGLANRQDLMNRKAQVTDAWRNVEYDANQLLAGLNLVYEGSLANDPKFDRPLAFDASNSTHRVGIRFDAPINRRAERNTYRASQITYQRARRAYMQTHDELIRDVRLDLRNLGLAEQQFEIAREQMIIAARQVEEAEYNVRNPPQNSESVALNLLTALNGLLQARNSLVAGWVQYETSRMSLFRDLDIMMIDGRGVWTNERTGTDGFPRVPRGPEGHGPITDPLRGPYGETERAPSSP